MGDWKLEVFKMMIYMAFPVGIFHYFNQPEYYESWLIKKKHEIYPHDSKIEEERQKIQGVIADLRRREEIKMVNMLEEETRKAK